MTGTIIDLGDYLSPDNLAEEVSNKYREWKQARSEKERQWQEVRNYLFATDTRTTSNATNPWKNTTTRPKLAQIRDNLHTNYMSSLFPNGEWLKWIAEDQESAVSEKVEAISSYMKTKLEQSSFESIVSRMVYDYIDYGNVFATVDFDTSFITNEETGEKIQKYVGPKVVRISPYDIVFNPLSPTFEEAPKLVRSVMSFGELKRRLQNDPSTADDNWEPILERMSNNRQSYAATFAEDLEKHQAYCADGFGSLRTYYSSGEVEMITLYGDWYDHTTDTLYENYEINVVDRAYVVRKKQHPSWKGTAPFFHVGWRHRPDNLYGMGPLDNLIGLQYRMDHLENLRADVFDSIAFPTYKIIGDVEEWDRGKPGESIYIDGEGDVVPMVPDSTALQADFQISELENIMEEMAGAPRAAIGIRTPGEKTAFEVQSLQNASSRIFQNKTEHFERVFIEPILNAMLEVSRRNMDYADVVRILDPNSGAVFFKNVTKDDITANGKIKPIGARHFARRAQRVQNLQSLHQIKLSDPTIAVHFSGKEFAKLLSSELGEDSLFKENAALFEAAEVQEIQSQIEEDIQVEQQLSLENDGV